MMPEEAVIVSVVCPFYNESGIIETAIDELAQALARLPVAWELIVVNDGSTDGSWELASAMQARHPRLRVLGYAQNKGRGYAIRTGVAAARGEIAITTEIDLSWGEDIVERLLEAMHRQPDADMIIASPNLPGGGYKNVPGWRVWLSQWGNQIIRASLSREITMYTGMTRAYQRARFLELPLDENEKEQHLEIASKALALGFRIYEIPATLSWKTDKLSKPGAGRRRSSAAIGRLIRTHLLFSVLAAPFRYTVPLAALSFLMALGLLGFGINNFFNDKASVFSFISAGIAVLFGLVLLIASVLTMQMHALQIGQWQLRRELRVGGLVRNEYSASEPDTLSGEAQPPTAEPATISREQPHT